MHRTTLYLGLSLISLVALLGVACGGGYGGSNYGGGGGGGGNVTSIAITPVTASITSTGMQQYTAVAKDSMGNVVTGAALVWASSNTATATINNSGLATAKAVGTTNITASITYSGGIYGMNYTYTSNTAMLTVTPRDAVMGMVATGHALAGVLVSLTDSRGRGATALSASDGRFMISIAGMEGPFLIKADDGRGRVMFGAAVEAGVANVDPLTDAMLRAWYAAHGRDPVTAFAAHAVPDAQGLVLLDRSFGQAFQESLEAQGLDADSFSLLSTPFDANSQGFDRLLDGLQVSRGGLSLTDSFTDQQLTVGFDGQALVLSTRQGMQPLVSVTRVELP